MISRCPRRNPWSVHRRLSSALYPLPFSLASAAAYLFPASVQQFYNEQLEARFTEARSVMLYDRATAFSTLRASRRLFSCVSLAKA